jgi:hypothetical protein
MFPRWEYSLFQSWFRRILAFQKPLAFLSKIINCFTNIFDSKQLKYSPKVFCSSTRKWQLKKMMSRYFWSASTNCHLFPSQRRGAVPRSQGLTADTALPKALAKTKTRSDLIGRINTMDAEIELINFIICTTSEVQLPWGWEVFFISQNRNRAEASPTSGALAARLKATNSGPKHYKLIWRNLYFITLNGYIVVILWWMSLKFSGRTKER